MDELISKQAAIDVVLSVIPYDEYWAEQIEKAIRSLPPEQPERKRYRHFKGGIYEVICEAAHHTERAESLVIYRNVKTGGIWARPDWMFYGYTEDGTKRFEEVLE